MFKLSGANNLAEAFAASASAHADNAAVRCDARTMTYRELDERSAQWAARLEEAGCAGRPVAVFQDRSADMVVAAVAVVRAGGWYVPLDPGTPPVRLSAILADADPMLALTSDDLARRLPGGMPVVRMDRPCPAVLPHRAEDTPAAHYCYAIFTSGTTGHPKGVAVSHANVLGLFRATDPLFDFQPGDTWTLFHSFAFDFSVWEMWGALLSGACVVVVPLDVARDPRAFWELLAAERVTVLSQTPTAFSRLIAEDCGRPDRLPLRWVVLGGEALRFADCRRWVAKYGADAPALMNMYGITETTVHASYHRIRQADLDRADSVIGRPLPGQDILLVDDQLAAVGPGEAGEILVVGPGVASGYLHDAELTSRRFVELPGPDGRPVRGYRSGDLAVRTPAGDLVYRGRADEQVKVRGHRIELGEVHAALTASPGVAQAVVVAHQPRRAADLVAKQRRVRTGIHYTRDLIRGGQRRGDPAGPHARLVAYIVPGPGFDADRLFAELRQRLPEYMAPAYVIPVDEIPANHNGKLDPDRLPAPSAALALRPAAQPGVPAGPGEPHYPVVSALCGVFQEVLGVDEVSPDDSFFSVGGDSILALDLCAAAERQGLSLDLAALYALQTPSALARSATDRQERREAVAPFSLLGEADRALLSDSGIEDAYPLARLQAGVLFHSAYGGEGNMYCDLFRFRLAAEFDREALQAAIGQAIARHDILRSSFHFSGFSEPLQIVHLTGTCPVTVIDLSTAGPQDQQAALDAWLAREQQTPYDWARPPLMRFTVHLLGGGEFMLWLGFHDALLDGWSESAFLTEVLTDYWRRCHGGPGRPAPRPACRFADFVALERACMGDEDTARFWSAELLGVEPMAFPRLVTGDPGAHHGRIGFLSVDIDPELSERLDEVARARNVSLKHVLVAAHARVQAALNGRDEVLLDIEWNGRPEGRGGTEVLGTHLNVVPYRLSTGGISWAGLIDAVWAKERELLPYRRYPYAELRQLARVPDLSDILFNYTHFRSYEALGLTGIGVIDAEGYNQTNLTLRVEFNKDPFTDLLNLDIEANLERVTEEQLAVTADLYRRALASLGSDTSAVPTLRGLMGEQRTRALIDGSQGPRAPLSAGGWFELFDSAAARHASSVAAVCAGAQASYGELHRQALATAGWLSAHGVRRGNIVGLAAERSISYLVAVLAVLRVGAVYLPLPTDPPDRLARMLRGCEPDLVLCDENSTGAITAVSPDTEVAQLGVAIAEAGSCAGYAGPPPGVRDWAYAIFTSGSTGAPKGAVVRHDGMLNHILAKTEALGLTPGDRVSQDAAATFDISVWQWLAPLAVGAATVIYPDTVGQDPARLLRALADDGTTVLELTPSTLNVMRAELERHGPDAYPPFALRWVLSQAETLRPRHANAFRRIMPEVRMLNMWGATELSDDCTHYEIVGECDERAASVPLGRPVRNVTTYVLDRHHDPVPAGTPGELYVCGVCVGAGYINDAERTAAVFVRDPFSPEPEAVMYRTGDRVRQLADGALEFLGRLDDQLKIHGQRIELAEVVTALSSLPEIHESTVVIREAGDEKQLVGFFVPRKDGAGHPAATASGIRAALRSSLPTYAIPNFLVGIDALPRTSHGKVDARALATWDVSAAAAADEPPEEPATPVEAIVLDVWTEILKDDRMAPTSNFFEHGGHSLHATLAMARLRDLLGVDLPVRALFENPTARELACLLSAEFRDASPASASHGGERIPPRPPGLVRFPLAYSQSSLWFLHELDPEDRAYESGNLIRLSGPLDVEALRDAIDTVAARHEILSTRFGSDNGTPFQFSAREFRLRLEVEDNVSAPAELARFDLVNGPVAVARLYQFSPAEHALEWTNHHIISDGWSNGIILREVKETYLARIEGRSPSLPALPVQYADFARWQGEFLRSPRAKAQLDYWRTRLAGYPGDVGLATDFDRIDGRSRTAGYVTRSWDHAAAQRLRDAARRQGVTPFTLFHAATAILVSKLGQRPDVVLGAAVAARSVPGTEDLVGFFANTLPFRYLVDLDLPASGLLAQVSETVLTGLDHQLVPFQEIVKTCGVPRRPGLPPLVQVFVTVDAYPFDASGFGELTVSRERLPARTSLFDLVFEFIDSDGQLELSLQYDASLFWPATARRLADAVGQLLTFVITAPDEPLAQARLLTEEDLLALAEAWHEVAGAPLDFAVPTAAATVLGSPHWDSFFHRIERRGLLSALLLAL